MGKATKIEKILSDFYCERVDYKRFHGDYTAIYCHCKTFSVSPYSHRNASGRLGEREIEVGTRIRRMSGNRGPTESSWEKCNPGILVRLSSVN